MHEVKVKHILSSQNGMNIYRGCSHGCIYCDARSTCYQINHEFEDIEVKINAPQLLEYELKHKRSKCMIGTGGMSDPYIPLEERLGLTRRCLEIIDQYEFGLCIQTKSDRILRDLDLIKEINEKTKAVVQITLTTADDDICRIVEPNVAVTSRRIEVLNIMKENNIPTVVWLDPILPFINDTAANIEKIVDECIQANVKGIICFGMGLTLRDGNREYFYKKLDEHFPGSKRKYIDTYGYAYEIPSPHNTELWNIFYNKCTSNGIICDVSKVFEYMKVYENKGCGEQLSLF